MKSISIKKIKNLLKRKDKKYTTQFNDGNTNIESNILLGSCLNIPTENEDYVNLLGSMSHIVISFIINSKSINIRNDIEKFYGLCMQSSVTIYYCNNGDKYTITISSNYNALAYLVNNGYNSNNTTIDQLIYEIDTYLSWFIDNRYGYANDEISYELIDPEMHRSFRRRYDEYISKQHDSVIEILGYSWVNDINNKRAKIWANCIWLSIDKSIQNEFMSMRCNSYIEEEYQRVLIKIPLTDFIEEMDAKVGSISKDTFTIIKRIFESDMEYFKYIYKLIDWDKYESSDYNNDSDADDDISIDEEYEEDESPGVTDEFIESLWEKILK